MCIIQYAEFFSWHCLCLIHAEAQLGHAGLEHLAHAVVLHDLHQHGEGLLLGHLHEQQAHDEGGPLAVAHLPVVVQYHPVTFSNSQGSSKQNERKPLGRSEGKKER